MFKLLKTMRAGILLGRAQGLLKKECYAKVLDKARKARNLKPDEEFLWLAHSITGKALYHLGQPEEALVSLREAERFLAPKLLEPNGSIHHIKLCVASPFTSIK
jgi:tetratricopeptide (TPR) repeat protein